jgi:predicted O-linked N-acetylglucosamine transferase (SPINDLY family)
MTVKGVVPVDMCLQQALSFSRDGHTKRAERLYRDILLTHPNQAEANYHLAEIELEQQQLDASLSHFKVALEAEPQQEKHWLSYISTLIQAEYFDEAQLVLDYGIDAGLAGKAVDSLRSTLARKLNHGQPEPLNQPIDAIVSELIDLFTAQHYAQVELKTQALLQQHPHWLVGWKILSDTLLIQNKDATNAAFAALQLNLDDAEEHCYYGLVLKNRGDLQGAAHAFKQAVKLKPDYAAAYNNLGIVEKDMGDVEAGISNYRRALQLNPSYASCFSNLLFCLSHSQNISTQTLFTEHRQFSQRYETPLKASWPKHVNTPDAERCLHIGFVSADFRDHALAYFIEPLLQHLAGSSKLVLHAYAASAIEDDMTLRLRTHFKFWNQVNASSDAALAQKIGDDAIDILIDLDGHTAGNRLTSFAMKPAPIQASWLGYLATTGLQAMDYYLADAYLLPPGQLDAQFTEQLVQLPANAPFMPAATAPAVNALPAIKNGYITFACFNRPNKITPSVVQLWCQLLTALPHSKMLLGAMPEKGSYEALQKWFAAEGISAERLIFHKRSSLDTYLEQHHSVDICLDTFPSNGVTTTCHAAWMGVPTLCLQGERLASRGALAVMQHMGLDQFITAYAADFVRQGVLLATQIDQLAEVRTSLRSRFAQSPLAQPAMIASALEQALVQMWQRWCKQQAAKSFQIKAP